MASQVNLSSSDIEEMGRINIKVVVFIIALEPKLDSRHWRMNQSWGSEYSRYCVTNRLKFPWSQEKASHTGFEYLYSPFYRFLSVICSKKTFKIYNYLLLPYKNNLLNKVSLSVIFKSFLITFMFTHCKLQREIMLQMNC